MKDIEWFSSVCSSNGLPLTGGQKSSFEKYRELLLAANRNVNLISRKDEENFYSNHALNSISFMFRMRLKRDSTLLDLGTGGGFPGIPIGILREDVTVVLLDSIAKKTKAVSAILDGLGLPNCSAVNGRAEELSKRGEFQARFDYVMSRAAGKLDDVAKWSRGFLRSFESASEGTIPVGTLIVLKGGEFQEELNRTKNLRFVGSVSITGTPFQGMDEIYNKEKKLILIRYNGAPRGSMN